MEVKGGKQHMYDSQMSYMSFVYVFWIVHACIDRFWKFIIENQHYFNNILQYPFHGESFK